MIRLLVFSFPLILFAAQRIVPEKEVSEKLAFYQKLKELKTTFHQVKTLTSLKMELKSEGEMRLKRPDEVTWIVKKPSYSEVRLVSHEIKILSGEGKEQKTQNVTLGKETDPNVSRAILSMMAWMRMDIPEIVRTYTLFEVGDLKYRCEPKDRDQAIFEALVFQLHPKGHVKELTIEEKSKDTIRITFETPQVKMLP